MQQEIDHLGRLMAQGRLGGRLTAIRFRSN